MELLHVVLEAFHPLHFVAGMGIGISSGIMYNFPIKSVRDGMRYIGIIYFFINLVVVVLTHLFFVLKYMVFPYVYPDDKRYAIHLFDLLSRHELAVFMGCSSMSFTTMVNMLHFLKGEWKIAVLVLWWINFAQAVICVFVVYFFTFCNSSSKINKTRIERKLDLEAGLKRIRTSDSMQSIFAKTSKLAKVAPGLLLPLLSATVAGASGSLISSSFSNSQGHFVSLIIITSMLIGIALATTFTMISVVFTKIFAYGLPKHGAAFTMFVPIGVMGQGSWGILLISKNIGLLIELHGFKGFGLTDLANSADYDSFVQLFKNIFMFIGMFISFGLIGFGITLTVWGVLSVCYWYIGWPRIHRNLRVNKETDKYTYRKLKSDQRSIASTATATSSAGRKYVVLWTPTMWTATFPFGTLALATNELYLTTNLIGFKVVSTIYSFGVILITTWCMICTTIYVIPWKKMYSALCGANAACV